MPLHEKSLSSRTTEAGRTNKKSNMAGYEPACRSLHVKSSFRRPSSHRIGMPNQIKGDRKLAAHINGSLYYERMGRSGPVMAFVHPNPMDQSCWLYQMAHLSTWYRCIAIDLPGYGRSPKAELGLTMGDMAHACWEAIDEALPGEWAILVGCSAGSAIVPHMHLQQPQRARALVLSGTGYNPAKEFAAGHAGLIMSDRALAQTPSSNSSRSRVERRPRSSR
jgi:pimeloyl-ACP methyl ester carboxylesterase